jgi:hypothetical protein
MLALLVPRAIPVYESALLDWRDLCRALRKSAQSAQAAHAVVL